MTPQDDLFMRRALELAQQAASFGEVPVGSVIVSNGQVLGEGRNTREETFNPIGHAEIHSILQPPEQLRRWRLHECTLYVTLVPCFMCAGAIVNARIGRVVFAAHDPKAGAAGSLANILQDSRLNHRCEVTSGVLANESAALLKGFFQERRRR